MRIDLIRFLFIFGVLAVSPGVASSADIKVATHLQPLYSIGVALAEGTNISVEPVSDPFPGTAGEAVPSSASMPPATPAWPRRTR